MKIHSIAIKFGDNDFPHTFLPLLESVIKATQDHSFSKYEIVRLINAGSFYHYRAFQNQFRYLDNPDHDQHIEKYLKVVEEDVLLNEDADRLAMVIDNYSTYYVSIYMENAIAV